VRQLSESFGAASIPDRLINNFFMLGSLCHVLLLGAICQHYIGLNMNMNINEYECYLSYLKVSLTLILTLILVVFLIGCLP